MMFPGKKGAQRVFMAKTRFIFVCEDTALNKKAARDFLSATRGVSIVATASADKSFLAEATRAAADAFRTANQSWKVYPEVKYKLPDTRLSIRKPK